MHWLTVIIVMPVMGALVASALPDSRAHLARWVATFFSLATFLISVVAAAQFSVGVAGMQLEEKATWIPTFGVTFHLGVDGLGLAMLLLTTLLSLVAVLASWEINFRPRAYFGLMLLLEASLIGVFVALDYVLFYIFWEVVLVPMYFLIGIWGGPRREYAALKFFLYTLAGSVVMLVGILALHFASGAHTFDMLELAKFQYSRAVQWWVFLAFFIGFAVKVPIFPLHTWLPDAHVEAPTAVSVLLAGVLLKMGGYGLIRTSFATLPLGVKAFAPLLALLGVINIIYGALAAMAQDDLKKMVAYSSISHMGFVILGLAAGTSAALGGAAFQMVSHGLVAGAMFLLVGMVYDRAHTRLIPELKGLFLRVPVIAVALAFAAFASLGLPGLSGFVGEFLVLIGSFATRRGFAIAVLPALLISAGYLLFMMQRVLMGKDEKAVVLPDMSGREMIALAPLALLILALGVYPAPLMRVFNPVISALATTLTVVAK